MSARLWMDAVCADGLGVCRTPTVLLCAAVSLVIISHASASAIGLSVLLPAAHVSLAQPRVGVCASRLLLVPSACPLVEGILCVCTV